MTTTKIDFGEVVGNNPAEWATKARNLIKAAGLVKKSCPQYKTDWMKTSPQSIPSWEEIDLFSIVQMLKAMALESYLKAIWLKVGEKLFHNQKYIGLPKIKDHDLPAIMGALAKDHKVSFSAKELNIAKRLTVCIFSGRYPLSKKKRPAVRNPFPHDGMLPPGMWVIGSDDDIFEALVRRLESRLSESDTQPIFALDAASQRQ